MTGKVEHLGFWVASLIIGSKNVDVKACRAYQLGNYMRNARCTMHKIDVLVSISRASASIFRLGV